jgi:hypothetical protein
MLFRRSLRAFIGGGVVLLCLCRPVQAQQSPETVLPSPPPVEEKAAPALPPVTGEATPGPGPVVEERPAGADINPVSPIGGGRGGGMGIFGDLANPTFGNQPIRATYGVLWFPQENVKNQNAHLDDVRQSFLLTVPCYQDSCNQWAFTTHVLNESIETGAIRPDTGREFPHELWNVSFGTNYGHLFDNGWIGGGNIHVGSASDRPFDGLRETTFAASAFLRVPQGEHNAWLFSLSFSTNNEVLNYIPIPGIAYFWAPVPWFQATVGLPFANVVYRPRDDLTIQVSYALLTTFHTRVTYRLAPRFRVFGAFDTNNESFLLVDRPELRDRFFYFDMRVSGGLQYELSRRTFLELSSGYAFDRHYFEGRSITQTGFDRVDVDSGAFIGLQVRMNF